MLITWSARQASGGANFFRGVRRRSRAWRSRRRPSPDLPSRDIEEIFLGILIFHNTVKRMSTRLIAREHQAFILGGPDRRLVFRFDVDDFMVSTGHTAKWRPGTRRYAHIRQASRQRPADRIDLIDAVEAGRTREGAPIR